MWKSHFPKQETTVESKTWDEDVPFFEVQPSFFSPKKTVNISEHHLPTKPSYYLRPFVASEVSWYPFNLWNDEKNDFPRLFGGANLRLFFNNLFLKDPGEAPESAFEFQPTKIKTMVGGLVSWKWLIIFFRNLPNSKILKGCGVSKTFSDGVVAWSVALAWMACFMAWPCSWFSQSLSSASLRRFDKYGKSLACLVVFRDTFF